MNIKDNIASAVPATQDRPSQVVTAVKFAVLNMILGYAAQGLAWEYYTSLQPLPFILLGRLAGLGFVVWVYYKIYLGRNWARILLLAMLVLSSIALFNDLYTGILLEAPQVSRFQLPISAVINVYILWLLFCSPGRIWFRRKVAPSVA